MNDRHTMSDESAQLIEEAIKRLLPWRRTFTEQEALGWVWKATGYEITIESDARFVLAQEGDDKHARHWRLHSHTLANNRILSDLFSGDWDGRDLDAEDGQHHVFCPIDPRFAVNTQGTLEPAHQEHNVKLPSATKAALDALGPHLLAYWQERGSKPWTVRSITVALGQLGWRDAEKRNGWPLVLRVGQDFWIPADQLPPESKRTRLAVLPIRASEPVDSPKAGEGTVSYTATPPSRKVREKADENQVIVSGQATAPEVAWSMRLRTIHLLEGYLPIPSRARGAYPPLAPGEGHTIVLQGIWYEDKTPTWLWLDRASHRFYGPDLAEKLARLENGDILHIKWALDIVVLRIAGHDAEVQHEESRLVDLEALSALRGGLGESYRRSLQAILQDAPQGLVFAEIVKALRERQQHNIHRGTIHALLYGGGFLRRDSRWFAAPDSAAGARQLREAMVEALVQEVPGEEELSFSSAEHRRARVKAIRWRLGGIIHSLK